MRPEQVKDKETFVMLELKQLNNPFGRAVYLPDIMPEFEGTEIDEAQ